jgi:hypothetical protein
MINANVNNQRYTLQFSTVYHRIDMILNNREFLMYLQESRLLAGT